jgi:hypothetical protein
LRGREEGRDDSCRSAGHSPSTIPEVQSQVTHELSMAVLNIDGSAETTNIFCDIVAEDDAAHGGFAGATLAHQQDLLFTFSGVHVDDGIAEEGRTTIN